MILIGIASIFVPVLALAYGIRAVHWIAGRVCR